MLRFTLITPVMNGRELIESTIYSILHQQAFLNGEIELEYIVIDGQSVDGTLEIIEQISKEHGCMSVISQNDEGMYDALSKGLAIATGDVIGYLNAGDLLHPMALGLLARIFENNHDVSWLTGLMTLHGRDGEVLFAKPPFRYLSSLIRSGVYGRYKLPIIQQESTFWTAELNKCLDLSRLSTFTAAGDYFLWTQHAQHANLHVIEAQIGGFRLHDNHLSMKVDYMGEVEQFCGKLSLRHRWAASIENILWQLPGKYQRAIVKIKPTARWSFVQDSKSDGRFDRHQR